MRAQTYRGTYEPDGNSEWYRLPTYDGGKFTPYQQVWERWRAPTDDAAFAKPVGSRMDTEQAIGCILDEECEPTLATSEQARTTSALASGAVANVVPPDCVPGRTKVT